MTRNGFAGNDLSFQKFYRPVEESDYNRECGSDSKIAFKTRFLSRKCRTNIGSMQSDEEKYYCMLGGFTEAEANVNSGASNLNMLSNDSYDGSSLQIMLLYL